MLVNQVSPVGIELPFYVTFLFRYTSRRSRYSCVLGYNRGLKVLFFLSKLNKSAAMAVVPTRILTHEIFIPLIYLWPEIGTCFGRSILESASGWFIVCCNKCTDRVDQYSNQPNNFKLAETNSAKQI